MGPWLNETSLILMSGKSRPDRVRMPLRSCSRRVVQPVGGGLPAQERDSENRYGQDDGDHPDRDPARRGQAARRDHDQQRHRGDDHHDEEQDGPQQRLPVRVQRQHAPLSVGELAFHAHSAHRGTEQGFSGRARRHVAGQTPAQPARRQRTCTTSPALTRVVPEPVRTASRLSSTSAAVPASGGPVGSSTRISRPTVTHQRRYSARSPAAPGPAAGPAGARVGGPGPVPVGQAGQRGRQQPLPVQAGRAFQEQRGRTGRRQFGRGEGDVEADPHHDRVVVRLGEDPGDLPVRHQHVVGPFQAGRHAARPQRGRHGDPGEQGQPAPGGRRHGRRAEQHRAGQRSARRAGPGPAEPAPARGCVSATSTSPSAAPARASWSRSALVEPLSR